MINSIPNNKRYHQGLYVPTNKDKVLKLNNYGGLFYRSSLEKKMMIFLDNSKDIKTWTAESVVVPYFSDEFKNGELVQIQRRYYPDFYYEMETSNGLRRVISEVKPKSEYDDAIMVESGSFKVPEGTSLKKLQSLEYRFKMAQKNLNKWQTIQEFCKLKGYEFIIITDELLRQRGL